MPVSTPPEGDSARLARNGLALVSLALIDRLAGFGFVLVAVRSMSQEAFGTYSLIQAVLLIGGMAVNSGLELVVVRVVRRRPDGVGSVFAATLVLMLASGALAWLASAVLMFVGDYPSDVRMLTILASSALMAMAVSQAAVAILKSIERMAVFARVSAALSLMLSILGIATLLAGGNLEILIALLVGKAVVEAGVLYWLTTHRHVPAVFQGDSALMRSLLFQAAPVALVFGYAVLMKRADTLILGAMRDLDEVAIYGTATRLMDGIAMITSSLIGALAPRLAAHWVESRGSSTRLYAQSVGFFARLSLPIACLLTFSAVPILTVLFGDAYAAGATALQLLAWANVCLAIAGPAGVLLIVSAQRMRALITFGAAVVAFNIALAAALIPPMGATGAALATLGSTAANLAVSLYLVRPLLEGFPRVRAMLLRPALATGVMAVTMFAGQQMPLVIDAAAGCLCYCVCLAALGEHREPYYGLVRASLARLRGNSLQRVRVDARAGL